MKRFSCRLCVAIAVVVASSNASLSAQMMPFHASTAMAIGFENRALRSFVRRVNLSGMERDGQPLPDPLDREMRVTSVPIVVPYAVHRTLVPIVMLPFVNKSFSTDTPDGRKTIENRGLGDATVLLKFVPLQWDGLNETKRLAFFSGVKFPTGSSDATDENGQVLMPELQLGTGAFEVPLGVSFSMQTPNNLGFVADFFYRLNTVGDASHVTDSFSYDLAVGATVYPSHYTTFEEKTLNLYLELNGSHEIGSGNTLFVSPGVQLLLLQNLAFEVSFQAPVYQKYRDARLRTDFALATGFRWVFPF